MPDPEPIGHGAETAQDDIHTALDTLHLGESSSTARAVEPEPNPWTDRTSASTFDKLDADAPERTLHTPDPSSLDPTATESFVSAEIAEPRPQASQDILLEFDPLASSEEQAAREAWASSEAHPPPPPVKDDIALPPAVPDKTTGSVSTEQQDRPSLDSPLAAATAFPGLAALARTFSIPLGGRPQRPRSLETAASVPSPATLSSFAQQQSAPPTRTMMVDPENSSATEVSGGSGRSTPGIRETERDRGKTVDKDSPPFDFQKFLDQMKLKGAEPVAKYLRSYVCALTSTYSDIDSIECMRAHPIPVNSNVTA